MDTLKHLHDQFADEILLAIPPKVGGSFDYYAHGLKVSDVPSCAYGAYSRFAAESLIIMHRFIVCVG